MAILGQLDSISERRVFIYLSIHSIRLLLAVCLVPDVFLGEGFEEWRERLTLNLHT
jgi:hypothetical protein